MSAHEDEDDIGGLVAKVTRGIEALEARGKAMSAYEDEDGIDGPAKKAWDAAMKEDAEFRPQFSASLHQHVRRSIELERVEALEAKCALLSASLKQADARAEAAEAQLAELVRRVHAYASLLEEGWSLHALAEDYRPEVKP